MELNIQGADFCGLKEFPDATIATIIAQHVANRPDRPAIVTSNEVLTFRALGMQIAAFGTVLRANGIGPSARVAIILPDGFELAVAIVATACHAVAVPLNPQATATEFNSLVARLHIDAIVTSNKIDTAARGVADRLGVPLFEVASDKAARFKILAAITSEAITREVTAGEGVSPNAPALILQTSATTGPPKLVPVTHRNLMINADRRRYLYNLTTDDRALCAMPLYYGHGVKAALFPLLIGASVALPDRNAVGDINDWLVDLHPTWYEGGQTLLMDVLERARMRQGTPLRHRLRFIRTGGDAVSYGDARRARSGPGVPVLDAYGLSERDGGRQCNHARAPQSGNRGKAMAE